MEEVQNMVVDLHVHTTASSDADYTPREIVEMAINKKLWTIAIADHDSVAGLEEGLYWGHKLGLEVIPGCEFYTEHKGKWLHILGYFLDFTSAEMARYTQSIVEGRKKTVQKQIEMLRGAGLYLEEEQIIQKNPSPMYHVYAEVIFADPRNKNSSLLKKYRQDVNPIVGFCMDWLVPGKPLNVPQYSPQAKTVIQLIRNSGGTSIIAHPAVTLTIDDDDIIDDLVKYGLAGVEIYTSWHKEINEKHYEAYVQDKELISTCGSDFHGTLKPKAKLGEIKNNSYEVVEKLKKSNSATNRHGSCI